MINIGTAENLCYSMFTIVLVINMKTVLKLLVRNSENSKSDNTKKYSVLGQYLPSIKRLDAHCPISKQK